MNDDTITIPQMPDDEGRKLYGDNWDTLREMKLDAQQRIAVNAMLNQISREQGGTKKIPELPYYQMAQNYNSIGNVSKTIDIARNVVNLLNNIVNHKKD